MYKYQAVELDYVRYEPPRRYRTIVSYHPLKYNEIVTLSDGKTKCQILFEME